MLSLLYCPTITTVHDYWKNHSFDFMDLYWQSDISTTEYYVVLQRKEILLHTAAMTDSKDILQNEMSVTKEQIQYDST